MYKASEYVKKVSKHFIWLNDYCKYTMLKICAGINYETSNLKVHQIVHQKDLKKLIVIYY